MAFSDRLHALLIDPAPESRATLKGLLENEQTYHNLLYQSVTAATTLPEAAELIGKGNQFDVMFISLRIALPVIQDFVRVIKAADTYGAISFILICNAGLEKDRALVAQGLALGADAFLLVPCSVDQLRTVSAVAQRIKVEAHERKIEASLKLIIEAVVTEIEKQAEVLYDGGDFSRFSKHLKSAVSNILRENTEYNERYLDILDERLALAIPRLILPAERLPRSKRLQEKLKTRQSRSKR